MIDVNALTMYYMYVPLQTAMLPSASPAQESMDKYMHHLISALLLR
jgi:hypothetical protein